MNNIITLYKRLSLADCGCSNKQTALNLLREELRLELAKNGIVCTKEQAKITAKKILKEKKLI